MPLSRQGRRMIRDHLSASTLDPLMLMPNGFIDPIPFAVVKTYRLRHGSRIIN